ncbi:MAG: hypothetical protein E6J60_12475 [Deltaproteobacteria bacterium]|nr:MAG: hypothetical protein E6J60_12475 [Deltaproteobacteria bacterium]
MTDDVRANAPAMLASGVVLGLVLFLIAAVWSSFTIIQPGNVGVVFNRWSGALIQNKAIDRWNGSLPQFTGGGAVPFLNLKDLGAADTHAAGAGH